MDIYDEIGVTRVINASGSMTNLGGSLMAPEVVEAIEIANHYGAGTIAITRPGSPVADAASVALTVEVGEYPDALTPTASRFAFLAILDVIAAATGYRLGPKARESLRRIKFNILPTRPGSGLEPLGD